MTEAESRRGIRAVQTAGVVAFLALVAAHGYRTLPPLAAAGELWLLLPAAVVAYLAADLVAGFVHWYCDTFFKVETPIIGQTVIRGFREHHTDPMGITRHSFAEVNGSNCWVMVPIMAVAVGAGGPDGGSRGSLALHAFLFLFALAIFATNQFHRWAHAENPPRIARLLQRWGLILTPERHAVHHSGGHDRGYCVTSGWLNPLLDRIDLFGRLERLARGAKLSHRT